MPDPQVERPAELRRQGARALGETSEAHARRSCKLGWWERGKALCRQRLGQGSLEGGWHRAPNPSLPSLRPRAGRSGHLSDEEPANFLVIPAEGGEILMVSCGETTFIAGAAAWVGG